MFRSTEADEARSPDGRSPDEPWQPTILIVDDDPAARLALAAGLSQDGYRIVFASDAAEVQQRLARVDPDVIVCDLVMEEMRGDHFIRWLQAHERWRLVPIIGVTGFDNQEVRANLLHAGADSVLVKPCRPSELRAHVRAALRTRHKYEVLIERYLRLLQLRVATGEA
jgi:DNA-binding response OmpR family regulator